MGIGFNEFELPAEFQNNQNVIQQPLYDTVEINAATFNINAFQIPVGGVFPISAVVKDKRHTNMTAAGQLPADNSFLIKTIQFMPTYPSVRPGGDPLSVWEAFVAEAVLTITVQDKTFLDIPLILCTGGGGPVIRDNAAGAGTGTYVTHGEPSPNAVKVLAKPIILKAGTAFQVLIRTTNTPTVALAAAARAIIIFDGLLARSIN